ncbi:MAG: ferrochelatase [Betaproteobacteria bacterium]
MFAPEPAFKHGSVARVGVLLVNLGTPKAPTAQAVKPYLSEFLSDPRVIEIPRAVWLPILHGVVLNVRPKQSAAKYAQIWTAEGSPLKVHTQRQANLLRGYLGERLKFPLTIEWAMRYGTPSISDKIWKLHEQGCDRLLVLPLYPQYSASATGTVYDAVFAALARLRNVPALRIVRNFHDHPGYLHALAQNIKDYWTANGRGEKLVMSFHGLPRYTLDRGDPYHCECHKTARLLANALGLHADQYLVTFQSRFGRTEWLKPYTIDVMSTLGKQNLKRVDVVCPGFVSDCLETLEEIAIENKAVYLKAGGGQFHYIPCLNERDGWIQALLAITLANLQGWLSGEPDPGELAASRQRATGMGARA